MDSQGYLWLLYVHWSNIWAFFSSRKYLLFYSYRIIVISSVLLSFLPYHCHSFRIIVIPSILVSLLPNYCHFVRIIVIPSELLSFVILNSSCTFLYPKGEKIGRQSRPYLQVQIRMLLEMISPYCGCGLLLPRDWIRLHRGPLFYLSTYCTRQALVDRIYYEVTRFCVKTWWKVMI